MTFSFFINSVDVSDHVLSSTPVPHIKRDRVLQPLAGRFNIALSDLVTPALDEVVLVKIGGDIRFSGYIDKIERVHSNHTYKVGIVSSLLALDSWFVDYDTLNATISFGATQNQYKAVDNEGYPNVAFIWLLQKMFIIAGLTLDTSNVEDLIVTGALHEHDLVTDENMLYALNQDTACNNLVVDSAAQSESEFSQNRITFYEFFQRYCIGRKWYVQPSTTAEQFIVTPISNYVLGNNYTVSDDDKINYSIETKVTTSSTTDATYNELKQWSKEALAGGEISSIRQTYDKVNFAPAVVDTALNHITMTDHRLKTNSVLRFTSTGALPSPLSAATTYYLVDDGVGDPANEIQVSTSPDGSVLSLTSQGTGTHSYYGEYELAITIKNGIGQYKVPYWNSFYMRLHLTGTTTGEVSSQPNTDTLFKGAFFNYRYQPVANETILTGSDLDFSKPRMMEHWLNIKDKTNKIKQDLETATSG